MEENNQGLNQNVATEEPVSGQEQANQTKFKTVGQINEKMPKKKKGKTGKIVFLLLILAIIAGLVYYFGMYTNTKVVYQQILKTGINSLTTVPEEVTTSKTKVKLDVDVDLNEEYMSEGDQELLKLINNIDAMFEVQIDTNEKKAICRLESNYEEEELLNLEVLMDVKNKGTYIKVSQFLDNILEIEMGDEYYNELELALESGEETENQRLSRKKAIKIMNNEFSNIIKDEYCSKEAETITIDSKEVKTNKYILKMSSAQLMTELKTVAENLKNNEEFLNCFEDPEAKKESLSNLLENIEDEKALEDETLCVKIYRAGLKQEFVRVDFEVEYKDEKLLLKVEKLEDTYELELLLDEEACCSGTIKVQEIDKNTSKLDINLEAEDFGSIELKMECGYVTNEPIDVIEKESAVKMKDLSTQDIFNAYKKLQESKIYDLVEDLVIWAYAM